MLKKIIVITLLCLFTTGIAYSTPQGSGEKTANAVISAGPCKIVSIKVITDGTNDAKVILYDNASAASGRIIDETTVTGANNFDGRHFLPAEMCFYGIYAVVSGTGASYIVSKED